MRVSGKVTHSFYCFLRARGFDVSRLYELTDMEMEFLKDPSQWLPLDQVESFLKKLKNEYASQFRDKNFFACVGHSCFELGAWGDLDSILKMKDAQPAFSDLPVFLSYFISDGFSLTHERKEQGFLSFKSNLSSEDFPFVVEYLQFALEALPVYTGKNQAEVRWIRNYIQIKWEDQDTQVPLFSEPLNINIKPEILRDLKHFLEKVEKELYYQRQKMVEKDREIRNLKDQMIMQGLPLSEDMLALLKNMEKNLQELKDSLRAENAEEKLSQKIDSLLEGMAQIKKGWGLS